MFLHQLGVFGTLLKSHGFQGEMIASVVGIVPDEFELPEALFIAIDGIPVPFFPEQYEVISDNSIRIKFDTIRSKEESLRFYNCKLMADRKWVNRNFPKQRVIDLPGYTVIDQEGNTRGKITEFNDIPGNPVITVNTGNTSLLLPVNDELIIDINEKFKVIVLKIPEGLISF